MAMIFALSSIRFPPEAPAAIGSDKGAHLLVYGGLCALVVRALAGGWRRPVTRRTAGVAVVISALYGASDELHQYFVPPRQMEARDLAADTAGAAMAALALYIARAPRRT
jgi:VanZ family protein